MITSLETGQIARMVPKRAKRMKNKIAASILRLPCPNYLSVDRRGWYSTDWPTRNFKGHCLLFLLFFIQNCVRVIIMPNFSPFPSLLVIFLQQRSVNEMNM